MYENAKKINNFKTEKPTSLVRHSFLTPVANAYSIEIGNKQMVVEKEK